MAWLNNVLIEGKELSNERLELVDKNSLYFLGPDLSLKNCTVTLKVSARNLLIVGARFTDCTFEVKQELKNHQQWLKAALLRCRFKGRLTGCDFGRWPDYGTGWEYGSIEDCDFTEARLDGCRIMGADPSTLRFPRWPCFTVLDPIKRASSLHRVQWPGGFRPISVEGPYRDPPCTTAVTFYAPSLATSRETSVESFRAIVEQLDGAVY